MNGSRKATICNWSLGQRNPEKNRWGAEGLSNDREI
jgi:hypothetical protein